MELGLSGRLSSGSPPRTVACWVASSLLLLACSQAADASCVSISAGPTLLPGDSLSLTCQTSNGGTPAAPVGGSLVYSLPTVPGSYTYGHGFGSPTSPLAGSAYGFFDDYVFAIEGATANSITSTISLGTLSVSDLQVRLYRLDGNTLPTLGIPAGGAINAWSAAISGAPGITGSYQVIPDTILDPGTYVLEVRGNVTGSNGGSYSGVLNLAPVPLPGAVWLLATGLLGLGAVARRRR